MKLLKEDISERDILTEFGLAFQSADQSMEVNAQHEHNVACKKITGLVSHPKRQYRFIHSSTKRFSAANPFKGQASFSEFTSYIRLAK